MTLDHHLASLSGRQIRPVHLSRPRLHRHGAAPATGPPPARRHGPPLDRGSTVLALQRFLRWLFEPSFRWVKQTLKIRHFVGVSENAVRIQIAVALIAFVLRRLAQAAQDAIESPLTFAR